MQHAERCVRVSSPTQLIRLALDWTVCSPLNVVLILITDLYEALNDDDPPLDEQLFQHHPLDPAGYPSSLWASMAGQEA